MAIPPRGHGEKEWRVTTETIQLLTPEGERVDHPEYPLGDVDIKGMYRDMVLVRRIDTEAIALQRQGELGLWASLLGQEAAQIGSARALSPRDMAFPSYREHGVAWCRGLDPLRLLEMFRGVNNGAWDPEEHKFHLYTVVIGDQTLHATGYAMGIQRDGCRGRGGDRLLRRRRHQPGRRERGVRLGVGVQRPGGLLLPEQPVRDLRAAGAAEPGPDLPAGQRLRLPRHPGRRQRRARLLRGDPPGDAGRPRGPGPHAHRGLHLPDGRAHHHRRPHQVPARRASSRPGGCATRSSASGPTWPAAARPTARSSSRSQAEADELAAKLRAACLALPDPPPLALFDHVYAGRNAILDAERAQYAAYLAGFEEEGAAR